MYAAVEKLKLENIFKLTKYQRRRLSFRYYSSRVLFFFFGNTQTLCTYLSICETCLWSQKRRRRRLCNCSLEFKISIWTNIYKEMTAHISKNWVSYSHCAGQILYSSFFLFFQKLNTAKILRKIFREFQGFTYLFAKCLSNQSWTLCPFKSRITCFEIFLLCIILSYLQGGR